MLPHFAAFFALRPATTNNTSTITTSSTTTPLPCDHQHRIAQTTTRPTRPTTMTTTALTNHFAGAWATGHLLFLSWGASALLSSGVGLPFPFWAEPGFLLLGQPQPEGPTPTQEKDGPTPKEGPTPDQERKGRLTQPWGLTPTRIANPCLLSSAIGDKILL